MPRPLVRLLLLVCAPVLVAGGLTAAPGSAEPPVTTPGQPAGAVQPDPPLPEQAQEALAEVEEIFNEESPADEPAGPGTGADPHGEGDATIALLELAELADELPPAQQQQAERYLARPTDPDDDYDPYDPDADVQTECVEDKPVCVHWVKKGKNQDPENGVPGEDDGVGGDYPGADNGIPDYVDQVLLAMSKVHGTYTDAGYRPPMRDGRRGGGPETDIYLAQIGDENIYGYCAPESKTNKGGASGYCVLDNDYAEEEYPALTPLKNMRVTAAHEYFHAIQFGYDVNEDLWFMEATATWAEDEVFDAINDNVFYLRYGPMRRPGASMDKFEGLLPYGSWIFFRYLSDHWGGEDAGEVPDLVRRMWQRADAQEGPDQYSLQAVRSVLAAEGTTLAEAFGDFARANRRPRATYEDDRVENRYPTAPLGGHFRLSPSNRKARAEFQLDHLTSRTLRYTPTRELDGNRWKLRVRVDLVGTAAGGVAKVLVKKAGEPVRGTSIRLRSDGTGSKVFAFDSDEVRWVEVVAVNASHRFTCWKDTLFSCQGKPRHDNKGQLVVGTAFKR